MINTTKYDCANIYELIDNFGKEAVGNFTSNFICSKNIEIQEFLKKNAYEFALKFQAITYFIFSKETNSLEAYFSLTIKPIDIKSENLSKRALQRILRISELNDDNKTVNPAAYLIAQIGKKDNSGININDIFEFIDIVIKKIQRSCGGVVEFLESENNDKLIDIYKRKGFNIFNIRKSKSGEDRKLIQMYRLI